MTKEKKHTKHKAKPASKPKKVKIKVQYPVITGILAVLLIISLFTGGFGIGGMSKKKAQEKVLDYFNEMEDEFKKELTVFPDTIKKLKKIKKNNFMIKII